MRARNGENPPVLAAFVSGLITGWAIAIPVGAVGVLVVATSARRSLRHGVAGALGVATVDGVYAAAAVVAGSAIAGVIGPYEHLLRILAALILLAMAIKLILGAWAPTQVEAEARAGSPLATFWTFVAITLVNPATVIYFAAIVLGNRDLVDGPVQAVVFVIAAMLASASWQLLLALAGAGLGRTLTGPTGRRVTGLVSGLLIAGLALATLGR